MTDKVVTSFPKVGTVNANPDVRGAGPGLVAKKNSKGGSNPDAGTATHRQGVLESLGHKGAPQMEHCYPNDPGASQTQRNVYLVPSVKGSEQFYAKRQYGQALQ